MMRIFLFLATNIAIMVVVSIIFSLFGLNGILASNGVDLDLNALLILSAVIGMTGSFISLAMSKWSAKRGMGVQIIEHPQNQTEQWLMDVVTRV
jgi:heat shock protein HtpX